MRMISLMNSISKIASMIDNETLADLQNKVLRMAANIQKLSEVEQINLENEWTELLKNLVDYRNKSYLRNFSLRLGMEVNYDYYATQSLGGRQNIGY
jgi:hypothetical protein